MVSTGRATPQIWHKNIHHDYENDMDRRETAYLRVHGGEWLVDCLLREFGWFLKQVGTLFAQRHIW